MFKSMDLSHEFTLTQIFVIGWVLGIAVKMWIKIPASLNEANGFNTQLLLVSPTSCQCRLQEAEVETQVVGSLPPMWEN